MRFLDSEHWKAFVDAMTRYEVSPRNTSTGVLLYLLTATYDCRCRIGDIITCEYGDVEIKDDAIQHTWVTSGDARVIRLAFNLFDGGTPTATTRNRKNTNEVEKYLPFYIFCGLDESLREVALEALRMRFSYQPLTNYEPVYIRDQHNRDCESYDEFEGLEGILDGQEEEGWT